MPTQVAPLITQSGHGQLTSARPSMPDEYEISTKSETQDDENDFNSSRRPTSPASKQTSHQNGNGNGRDKERDGKNASRLDPLSTQIYLRSGTPAEPTIAQRILSAGRPDSPNPDTINRKSQDLINNPPNVSTEYKDHRKKGPSFLARLAIRGNFKKDIDGSIESDSEHGDSRTDGSSARAQTSVFSGGGGYIPLHKEPPRYIRVKAHNKKDKEYNHLFLAQELLGTKAPCDQQDRTTATAVGNKILKGGDAIWAAEFSVDGKYLAVGGKDQTVRVFAVISTPEERRAQELQEEEEAAACREKSKSERLSAPVFRTKPVREFTGHTGEVLAVSWSKNNFLLTSSMDKTVRLWHLSRQECICTFKHDDLVTSIAFHPTDDRFFLAGSLDAQLRLWSIPDKSVAFSAPTNEFITAVGFSPDGKTAICGLLSGICIFYETEGLKNPVQIHVRSSRGKNAKGSKITGIRTIIPAGGKASDTKVMISSNDSRVRIYNLKTKALEVKFKGHENQSSQIHARFSDDGRYIASGSEDRKAYLWSMDNLQADMKDKQPYECFDAHPEVVTTALVAPTASKVLLSAAGDPIFDLCNPPPVTLVSLDEASASRTTFSDVGQGDASTTAPSTVRKQAESPAYVQRCKHMDGNIIVTTDRMGMIKVFRQDCAYAKRHMNQWETGSKFSGKVAAGIGRSGSIVTRTSNGGSRVNSRRGSLNLGGSPAQVTSERINSWRQDVEPRQRSDSGTPSRTERSVSPVKANRTPLNASASNLASEARKLPYISSSASAPKSLSISTAATTRPVPPPLRATRTIRKKEQISPLERDPSQPPTPSFSLIPSPQSESGDEKGEGSFWNITRWRGLSGLRNVTTASSTTTSNPAKTSGHGRNLSEAQTAADKAAARKSLGVADLKRLIATEETDRRKSVGPQFAIQAASGLDSEAVSLSDSVPKVEERSRSRAEKRRTSSPGKRRTDSGVAQLSGESDRSE